MLEYTRASSKSDEIPDAAAKYAARDVSSAGS